MSEKLKQTNLWLSICLPIFNVEAYLKECLDSIVNQIDSGVEVLLLDDCSTDKSAEIAEQFVKQYPEIFRLTRLEKNKGLSMARNAMIDLAKGEYIWFVDSDDVVLPGAVDSLRKAVLEFHPDMVICDFKIWRQKEKLKYKIRGEFHRKTFPGSGGGLIEGNAAILKGFFTTGQMHVWTKIVKREVWLNGPRFPVGKAFEDMSIVPRISLLCANAVYLPEVWIAYRQRSGSIISTMNQNKLHDLSVALLDFRNDTLSLDESVRLNIEKEIGFAMTHICARNMITVLKVESKENVENKEGVIKEVRSSFDRQAVCSYGEFLWGYLKRGWLARCLRFVYFYKILS